MNLDKQNKDTDSPVIQSKYATYIFVFVFISLIVIIELWDEIQTDKIKYGVKSFNYIEVSGIVQSICQSRGTVIMRLKKEPKKKYFFESSENHQLYPYYIDKFILRGDSIYKPRNSNMLHIYRGRNEYYFLIGETIKLISYFQFNQDFINSPF